MSSNYRTLPRRRAIALLKAYGWSVHLVESWDMPPGAKFRRSFDLLGFADLLAFRPGLTLAVQVTSADNVAAHVRKMKAIPAVLQAVQAGWFVELWGVRTAPDADGEALKVRRFVLGLGGMLVVEEGRSVIYS